jgi:DNA-binding transcriptional LysR family regulator
VRALEELLGVKLLVRSHRSISFTAEGERLFRCADEALRSLQEAVGLLQVGAVARPVTISCSIGVAGLWLLPRLAGFLQRHPKIDVRISASNELSNLRSAELDVAIRYCSSDDAPAGASRLFGETVAPVAHPSVGLVELRSPRDLEKHVLLEFDGEYRPWLRWSEWLAKQGWEGAKPKAVLRFNQYDQLIHAAMGGQGVALGRLELVGPALADGRLSIVRSPGAGPVTQHAYWLIRTSSAARPEVDEVIGWILEEADKVTAPSRHS